MKNKYLELIEKDQFKINIPILFSGDFVEVSINIKEGNKERIQIFKGFILKIRNRTINTSFTVRKISSKIGVERTFFVHSPIINNINVIRRSKVNRAKLYYMRERTGKSSRIKEKLNYKNNKS